MTARSILGGMAARLTVAFINLAVLVVSSRYLGAASRGEISLFLLNIALVQLINEIYTGYALIHFVPRFDSRRLIAGGFVFTLLVAPLVNFLIVAGGAQVLGQEWVAAVTSLLVILNTFNCIVLLGKQKVHLFNLFSILQPALLLGGLLVSIFVDRAYTFTAFSRPLLFSFLVAAICSSAAVWRFPRQKGEYRLAPLLRQGFYYQSAVIMFLLANRFSYYLLPAAQQVGVYAAASSMMDAALILAAGMAPAMLSRLANEQDPRSSALLTLALAKLSVVITLCCVAVVFMVPGSWFVKVLGLSFEGLRQAMIAYSPGVVLASFMVSLAAFFTASGRQQAVLVCYGLGLITTLCVAPVLVNRWQVTGAAFTAGLSYLLMTVVMSVSFVRHNRLPASRFFSLRPDAALLLALFRGRALPGQ